MYMYVHMHVLYIKTQKEKNCIHTFCTDKINSACSCNNTLQPFWTLP